MTAEFIYKHKKYIYSVSVNGDKKLIFVNDQNS